MPANYRSRIRLAMDNTLQAVVRKPRKWASVNVLLMMGNGAVIGIAVGAVATVASNWSAPWPYIGYMVASLLTKVAVTNLWGLFMDPWLGKETERFARRGGIPVPQNGGEFIPTESRNAQLTSTLTVIAACIGTALALGTKESQGSWLVASIPIWVIIMTVGGIVAAAEALTHKEVMRGIWRNEFSYQSSRRRLPHNRRQQKKRRNYRKPSRGRSAS